MPNAQHGLGCKTMHKQSSLYIFGEVLFDHFPDGSRVLGGAPFNVAWHLQAFGQSPRFISAVGNDSCGHEIKARMEAWGMRLDGLQIDAFHPTGSVQVSLAGNEPHYDIVADSAYDFIAAALLGDGITEGILYHGSLALRNPVSYAALQAIKAKHQGKVFMDVNLRAPWWDNAQLIHELHDADWVKLNTEELLTLSPDQNDLHSAMLAFYQQFDLDTLVVTLGEQGAIAYNKNHHFVGVKPSASVAVVDTVGAGDAFCAILLLGINQCWALPDTLERAQAFASAMVGQRGATVTRREFYRDFIAQWP